MNFGAPENLVWIWLLVPGFLMLVLGHRVRARRLALLFPNAVKKGLTLAGRPVLGGFFVCAAIVLITFALSQPRWGFQWQEVETKGVDIMVAIDVSQSMLAQDVKPNRLERAKREIIDLLDQLQGDRVGVIAFAGIAFVQCPLTNDYRAVRMFLDYLDTDLIPVQGTAIGEAIHLATTSLKETSPEYSKGRALILISDGEDHDPKTEEYVEAAKKEGVRIYPIGIGSKEGAPIPSKEGGFKKDAAGNMILSRLAGGQMQRFADETDGIYVRSVAGDMDLERIYRNGIRGSTDEQEYSEQRRRLWYERFQWFVGLAFLLLVLEWFFRFKWDGKGRLIIGSIVLLWVGGFAGGDVIFAAGIRQAEKDFKKGDYKKAEEGFRELSIEDPDDLRHAYNQGVSSYKNKDFDQARDQFAKVANEARSPEFKAGSLYNLGNAEANLENYDGAIDAYQEALKINPELKQAQENLSYVQQMKEMKKQQQQGNDKKDGEPREQKEQQGQSNQSKDGDPQQQQQNQKGHEPNNKDQHEQQSSQSQQAQQSKDSPQNQAEKPNQSQEQNGEKMTAGEQKVGKMNAEEARKLLRGIEDKGAQIMSGMMQQDMEKARERQKGKDW